VKLWPTGLGLREAIRWLAWDHLRNLLTFASGAPPKRLVMPC
jgi:hypothetical protein